MSTLHRFRVLYHWADAPTVQHTFKCKARDHVHAVELTEENLCDPITAQMLVVDQVIQTTKEPASA